MDRKRRISEILPASTECFAPNKRSHQDAVLAQVVQRRISFQPNMTTFDDTNQVLPDTALTEASATTIQPQKAKLITPQSSFLELRRVSVLNPDDIVDALPSTDTSSDIVTSEESSFNHDGSDVFEFPQEDESVDILVPPYSATSVVVTEEPTRQCSPVEHYTCDPTELKCQSESAYSVPTTHERPKPTTNTRHAYGWISVVALTLVFVAAAFLTSPVVLIDDPNSIYVPGGGFSGFWFTLGRLNSIENPLDKKFYCYSAGCLGVVTMLSNITMTDAYGYAAGAQKRWQRGELSRYDVTESFVDDILYQDAPSKNTLRPAFLDSRVLSTLRIITSERHGTMGVKAAVRTPRNAQELKEMLLQTTWIPFAISRDLWHEEHMDGAFTLHEHPRCLTHLGYNKLEWDLMLNALNVNLSFEKVQRFWQKGLALGLDQ